MGLQTSLLFFTLCTCCFSFCRSSPLSSFPGEAPGHGGMAAYPTLFSSIGEDVAALENEFAAAMGLETELLDLEGFGEDDDPSSPPTVISVDDHGASGDGTDDTEAFEKAWKEACSSSPTVLLVPGNKSYLLKQISFSGPCKANITVKISGTIEASSDIHDWDGLNRRHWIVFRKVANLRVEGGGTINGNGEVWWENSCKRNKSQPCRDAPTAVTFSSCNGLVVDSLQIKNSQQIHVSFEKCRGAQASNLMITAPEKSPNTDGIHVTGTRNITITNCLIGTGDDCISIVSGSKNVRANNIKCGPGHGISIGSLGKGNSEDHVSQVAVDGAHFDGTTNGVRIKTWQGGSGEAKNIQFQNLAMNNVSNPIIIDQNYCDSKKPCPEQDSAVEVSNVVYRNVKGTSATDVAIKLDCSKSVPCHGIVLQDIYLEMVGGESARTKCINAVGLEEGIVIPSSCF